MNEKERPEHPMYRLKNMYFAMHCWKCKKFELPDEEYKQRCENKIQEIIKHLDVKKMKFKDFNEIIKNSLFCKFEKREFHECQLCKKFGL